MDGTSSESRRRQSERSRRGGRRSSSEATGLTLRIDSGAPRAVPLAYAAEHLEHGYALTGHAAQGATVECAYGLLHDQAALRELGYVACTRARIETRLYLAERAREHETHGHAAEHAPLPERVGRALARPAREQLALEQTIATTNERLLADRRRELQRQRDRAREQLAVAETKLDALGWRGCGRRGDELRRQIAFRRTALARLEQHRLDPPPPSIDRERPRPVLAIERKEKQSRSIERSPEITRNPPGRGWER